MNDFIKKTGKVIGKAAELLLGALGGMLWASAFSLSMLFLFRAGHIAGWLAALLAVLAFVGLILWGLIRSRVSMCYAIPLVLLFLTANDPAPNEKIPVRPVLSILLLIAGLIALCLAAALVEMPAFIVGVCILSCYGVVALGIARDLDR